MIRGGFTHLAIRGQSAEHWFGAIAATLRLVLHPGAGFRGNVRMIPQSHGDGGVGQAQALGQIADGHPLRDGEIGGGREFHGD